MCNSQNVCPLGNAQVHICINGGDCRGKAQTELPQRNTEAKQCCCTVLCNQGQNFLPGAEAGAVAKLGGEAATGAGEGVGEGAGAGQDPILQEFIPPYPAPAPCYQGAAALGQTGKPA